VVDKKEPRIARIARILGWTKKNHEDQIFTNIVSWNGNVGRVKTCYVKRVVFCVSRGEKEKNHELRESHE
jgi:hypothetical protein